MVWSDFLTVKAQIRVAISTLHIAKYMVVCPVFLDDIDDMLEGWVVNFRWLYGCRCFEWFTRVFSAVDILNQTGELLDISSDPLSGTHIDTYRLSLRDQSILV